MVENEEKRKSINTDSVPYIVYESSIARMERINKRFLVLILVIFLAFVGTNLGWIIYENSFEDVTISEIEQTTDGDGRNYIVGGDFNGDTAAGQSDENQKAQNGR